MFADSNHVQREKDVYKFLNDTISGEINIVNLQNDNGNDMIPLRVQMVLTFSLLDILASYWYEFLDKTDGEKGRFRNWYETFCQTEENKEQKKTAYWELVSSLRLYNLRSSLVHFFGLSQPSEGIYIAIVSNDLPEKERQALEKRASKNDKKTVAIKPRELNLLIKAGGILMLNGWEKMIKEANDGDHKKRNEYVDGINRIWKKIQLEGAIMIQKKK